MVIKHAGKTSNPRKLHSVNLRLYLRTQTRIATLVNILAEVQPLDIVVYAVEDGNSQMLDFLIERSRAHGEYINYLLAR